MDNETIKERAMNNYEKPDKPTNHRVPRRPVQDIPIEERNENWYQ